MPKKKILLIAMGGTFASINTPDGLKPGFNADKLLSSFTEAKKLADIDSLQISNLDSTNIHPKHWTIMTKAVADNYDKYDGFVISHGTDTMHYSSAALSFALKGIQKPVVLTGSALSIQEPESDAEMNFIDAVRVASSDLVKEVCICFHHNIIKGTRGRKITNEATKITNEQLSVFSSINLPLIGTISENKIIKNKDYAARAQSKNSHLEIFPKFDLSVGHIKLFPGLEASILDNFKNKKTVVLEAFAPGNIPFDYSNWLEKIRELTKKEMLVFVTTQCPFGEVNMKLYEVGQKAMNAGAIPCHDMTPETALVKLMWILGNFPKHKPKQIKNLFLKNICGELLVKK
jgi:L-asparaginase